MLDNPLTYSFFAFLSGDRQHLWTLAFLFLLAMSSLWATGQAAPSFLRRSVTSLLAFFCLSAYPLSQYALKTLHYPPPLDNQIPLHFCDITAFLAGFALLTKKQYLCELTYFWGFTGTFLALFTPNLFHDFPHPLFLVFFLQHGSIVIAALILPLSLQRPPRKGSWKKASAYLFLYAFIALPINSLLKTNFGFLCAKPQGATPMDWFPQWPWYLVFLGVLGCSLFYLLEQPFNKKNI